MRNLNALLLTLFACLSVYGVKADNNAIADSISARFLKQSMLLPLEKIYAQIDKPVYVTGETVWFRAHLVNAQWHVPDSSSRYVYAELISPEDSVVQRVKIMGESGVYAGHLKLAEDMPEGSYMLRFYTRFMENAGDDYFFKRYIRVGSPLSASYHIEHTISYEDNNKNGTAELQFIDNETQEPFTPDEVRVRIGNGTLNKIKLRDNQAAYISLKTKQNKNQQLYVEYDFQGKFHKQFIPIPPPKDFDVTFHPEGGSILNETVNKIAFKAINSQGYGEDINITVMDEQNNTITTTKSTHLGMGYFTCYIVAEKSLRIVCKNEDGIEKSYDLPKATHSNPTLEARFNDKQLYITLRKAERFIPNNTYYLIAQSRGHVLNITPWDFSKEYRTIPKETLPSGVTHLILIDNNLNPISKRLVFNINSKDLTDHSYKTNKTKYKSRDKAWVNIQLKDNKKKSVKADLSISITDRRDVLPDTCVNILSSLLLTSDLKGHIEAPAQYFTSEKNIKEAELDLLMMTQGWRKYKIKEVIKGNYTEPAIKLEQEQVISGSAKGGLFLNKNANKYPISVFSTDYPLWAETTTDSLGCFTLFLDAPDSSTFIIQALTPKENKHVMLTINNEAYPPTQTYSYLAKGSSHKVNNVLFNNYINKANQQYIVTNGIREVLLKEVEVTALASNKKGKSLFSSSISSPPITSEEFTKYSPKDIYDILVRLPGVQVYGKKVLIRKPGSFFASTDPLFLVDDYYVHPTTLDAISIHTISQVEVLKGPETAILGARGANGVIIITTKRGEINNNVTPPSNIQRYTPLGYQIKKEFYAPKYETFEEKNNPNPDLRSTIHWIPSLKTSNDGKATFEFYTADAPSDYTVIIEGVTSDGKLVYGVETISRKD